MAENTINTEGTVNSARGVNPLNAVADVDPRKALIFTSVSAALTNMPISKRAEGLELKVRNAEGGIDYYHFQGGIQNQHFVRKSADLKTVRYYLTAVNSKNGFSEREIIADAINKRNPLVIPDNVIPRFNIYIEGVFFIVELIGIKHKGLYGNDPQAKTVGIGNVQILDRYNANLGSVLGDQNTQTIIINPDTNQEPQNISPVSTIQDYIKNNGPYEIQSLSIGNTRFKININGQILNYLYNGTTGTIGINNYQPDEADFIYIDPDTSEIVQSDFAQTDNTKLDYIKNKPAQYARKLVTANKNFDNTDNNKTLIIDGNITLTFPASIIEDFNFNFKIKAGSSLVIANGSKTLLDTEENVVTSLTANEFEFGTCYQFDVNTFIVEGITL